MIEIIFPKNKSIAHKVGLLKGKSTFKNAQLYVLSNDGKWYLQRSVRFLGNSDNFYCTFFVGNNESKLGQSYTLALVESSDRPYSPVDFLNNIAAQIKVVRL